MLTGWFDQKIRIGCLLTAFAVSSVSAQAPSIDTVAATRIWSSTASSAAEFQKQVEDFYTRLYNLDLMPVSVVSISERNREPKDLTDKQFIDSLLKRRGAILTSEAPVQLHSILCDLNKHVCSRNISIDQNLTEGWNARSIKGMLASSPNWRLSSETQLLVPSVTFVPRLSTINYTKSQSEDIGSLIVNRLQGCARFDQECQDQVISLNRGSTREIFSDPFSGELSLPVVAANAYFTALEEFKLNARVDRVLERPDGFEVKLRLVGISPTQAGDPVYAAEIVANQRSAVTTTMSGAVETIRSTSKMINDLDVSASNLKKELDVEASAGRPTSGKVEQIQKNIADLEQAKKAAEKTAIEALATVETTQKLNQFEARRVIEKQINSNLIFKKFGTPDSASTQRLFQDDFRRNREILFEAIKFPYKDPNAITARGGRIAVLDGRVAAKHCAFTDLRPQLLPPAAPPASPPCNLLNLSPTAPADHATHVVGIIASMNKGNEYWSLNPYASVQAIELDMKVVTTTRQASAATETGSETTSPDTLQQQLSQINQSQHDVVNISFGYIRVGGNFDPIQSMVATFQKSVLFVAAAGNSGSDNSHICDVRPACFDYPNLISVAALDAKDNGPSLLSDESAIKTDYGQLVHIGAYGKKVLSLVTEDMFGYMSGTSQAAPIVSAVASMLMVKYKSIMPSEVKNRLIYCSDITPNLRGKLFGGALNASCTLDGDSGHLKQIGTDLQRGQFETDQPITFGYTTNPRKIPISTNELRGIQQDPSNGNFTIFFTADQNPSSRLYKESNLKLIDPNVELKFLAPDGISSAKVRVSNISKYAVPVSTVSK